LSLALAATLLSAPVLAGCSAGTDGLGGSDEAGDSAAVAPADRQAGDGADGSRNAFAVDEDAPLSQAADDGTDQRKAPPVGERDVISTGTVSLRADDVGAARFDVGKVIDEMGGQIGEEDTETDKDGEVRRSRLVVRVPAKRFDATVAALTEVAELIRTTRASEDVTTQVIDTAARLRAQAASLERVEALLTEAATLKDVVAIEAQLTRRQADLDSLRSQQAYLADQTSLSTVTVHLERTGSKTKEKSDDTGFLTGLAAGWGALVALTAGAATALGATLPFLVLLAVLGLPVRLLLRRRRQAPGAPAAAPTEPTPDPA
ncbi:DUF4349 domain-containing protein, partial [Nocardioides sp.]|uniref:DUF4349 domain-containing protein n=1 Tax=Nocardioides sp. TaxID=35761 RepID=UPI0027368461